MLTGIFKGSHSIVRITYGTHQSCGCATCTFSYTGSDQHLTIHAGSDVTFDVRGAGSNVSAGGRSTGTKHFDDETELSIMVGGNGGRTNNGTTYGFGGSTTYGGRGGGGLSGVFTGSGAIGDNDSARALIIAGGAGGGRTGGGAGGGTNGQNGNGGSYGWAGGGASQTAKGSGNSAGGQFHGGGGSGTYGFGGGGGRYGGGGSGGDGSGDDDANAGGGSGYIGRVNNGTTTVGGGSGAGTDGSANITYTYDTIVPNEYVEGYLGSEKVRPNHGLPPEYQQIQYIQSSGAQWIDTGLFAYNYYQTEVKIEVSTTTQNIPIFGTYPNDTASTYYHLTPYSSKFYFGRNNVENNAGTYNATIGQQYKIIFNDSNSRLIVNDVDIASTAETVGAPGTTLTISRRGGTSQSVYYGQFKYFYFKIFNKNTGGYVREMYPCYRKSDGVVGMYDIVNNQFYTNKGTGEFIAGPDIGISLDRDRIGLPTAGDTYQLVVTAVPEEIGDVGYTWTSSDPDVATVSSTGLVTCVTPGECTIVCTTNDGKYQATCSVIPSIPDYDFYYDFRGGSLAGFQAAGGTGIWTDGSYTIDSGGLGQTGGSNDRNTHAYITGVNFEGATFASIERLGDWIANSWSNGKGMGAGTSYNGGNGFNGPGVWGRINLNTSSPGTYSTNGLNYYSPDGEVTDYANYASNGGETTERLEIDFINNTAKYILTGANSRTFQIALTVAQKELLRSMTGVGWNWGRGYSSYNSERIRRVKIHIEY